jgi:hypothetical protein
VIVIAVEVVVIFWSSVILMKMNCILEDAITMILLVVSASHAEEKAIHAFLPTLMQIAAMSQALAAHTECLPIAAALTEKNGMRPLDHAKLLLQQTLAQEAALAQ